MPVSSSDPSTHTLAFVRSARDFFKPLAVGAPAPLREIPFRPSRVIHFFPPQIDKVVAKFDGGIDPTKGCFEKLENKNPNDCITFDDTGSGEAVQGLFPLLFVCLFLSSMNLPRNLIEIDWFRYAATANPVSYLIEGIRSLIITGWDWQALGLAFGIAAVLGIASLGAGAWALRMRLTRT